MCNRLDRASAAGSESGILTPELGTLTFLLEAPTSEPGTPTSKLEVPTSELGTLTFLL